MSVITTEEAKTQKLRVSDWLFSMGIWKNGIRYLTYSDLDDEVKLRSPRHLSNVDDPIILIFSS